MLLCTDALGHWAFLPGGFYIPAEYREVPQSGVQEQLLQLATLAVWCSTPQGSLPWVLYRGYHSLSLLRINGQEHKTVFPGLTRQQSVKPALLCPPMIIMTTMPFLRF